MESKLILSIEDDPDDQMLLRMALTRNRISNRIISFSNGMDALDYLLRQSRYASPDKYGMPAVVLLDLKLPGMNGLEVLRQLRTHEPTRLLPIVILTSSREQQDVADSYRHGCNSYIQKPVNYEDFVEAVKRLANYWLKLNEPPPG